MPDNKTKSFGGRCTAEKKDKITRFWEQKGYASETDFWMSLYEKEVQGTEGVATALERIAAQADPFENMVADGRTLGALADKVAKIAATAENMDTLLGKLEGFEQAASGQKEGLDKLLNTLPTAIQNIQTALEDASNASGDRKAISEDIVKRLEEIANNLLDLRNSTFGDADRKVTGSSSMIKEMRNQIRLMVAIFQEGFINRGQEKEYQEIIDRVAKEAQQGGEIPKN